MAIAFAAMAPLSVMHVKTVLQEKLVNPVNWSTLEMLSMVASVMVWTYIHVSIAVASLIPLHAEP